MKKNTSFNQTNKFSLIKSTPYHFIYKEGKLNSRDNLVMHPDEEIRPDAEKLKLQRLGQILMNYLKKIPKPEKGIDTGNLHIVQTSEPKIFLLILRMGSDKHTYSFDSRNGKLLNKGGYREDSRSVTITPDGTKHIHVKSREIPALNPLSLLNIISVNIAAIEEKIQELTKANR